MREPGSGTYEIVRAGESIISAVVHVTPLPTGARADFRFNGFDVEIAMHVADMTKGW